jgi:hypothetical protein
VLSTAEQHHAFSELELVGVDCRCILLQHVGSRTPSSVVLLLQTWPALFVF